MFGYEKKYQELLELSGLETLEKRRENAIAKFAKKASENDVYAHLFKKNPAERRGRNTKAYKEDFARTSRLYNSPLFYMTRVLNQNTDSFSEPSSAMDLAHIFNDPFD